jgi:hypothetical protein
MKELKKQLMGIIKLHTNKHLLISRPGARNKPECGEDIKTLWGALNFIEIRRE